MSTSAQYKISSYSLLRSRLVLFACSSRNSTLKTAGVYTQKSRTGLVALPRSKVIPFTERWTFEINLEAPNLDFTGFHKTVGSSTGFLCAVG